MTPPFSFLPPPECEKPYTVSQINEGLALIIESGNTLVWVEGEVSNFKHASSGHCYFKLKDQESQVPAVLWRSAAAKLEFEPEDGMAVSAIASIRVYTRGGYYQLDVHRMQPSGIGALWAAFEKLKAKLEQEGLFDEAHKKAIPAAVSSLGVITAKGGAAVRDIIRVVARRAPQTTIVLRDVLVQGEQAPAQIAAAVADMNVYGAVDCIIVGRGGGSVEDLWAFNDERVARAIFSSRIPVISAVGHEIDFTIADFVADVRAPTPSAAAEMAVPDQMEGRRYVGALMQRFGSWAARYFQSRREAYARLAASASMRRPVRMLQEARQELDEARERTMRALSQRYRTGRERFARAAAQLGALSPLAVLSRGYSVVQKESGETVKEASQLSHGQRVTIRFCRGRAAAEIREVEQ